MNKITIAEYQSKMKEKYSDIIKSIDNELLSSDSWSRGELLYDWLEESNECPEELKYYVFSDWWTSIDSYHSEFDGEHIKDWIEASNINMYEEIKKSLIMDDEGYIKVYRGTHEHSQSWDGMSWTTDKEIARKFANGCGIRFQTKNPAILTGKVAYFHILGIFNSREESEILCYVVEGDDVENLVAK